MTIRTISVAWLVLGMAGSLYAAGRGIAETSASPHVQLRNTDLDACRWTDGFWADRFSLCHRTILPNMLRVMQKPDNSANFVNLEIAAGRKEGKLFGNNWSDGDCYKWIEAAAHVYSITRDAQLDRWMDEKIDVIAAAQCSDGYISTQIQLTDHERWEDLKNHELYNMGHLLTAACIHHRATGKTTFLEIARKLGAYLHRTFSPRPKELAHFGFNPSNIMGAAELYRTTGDRKYLELAKVFVDMRGSVPGGTDQNQDGVALRREREAVGHAVTAGYLWCGAADVYAETGEKALLDALKRLWTDVTERKMYVTGAVGALHQGECARALLRKWPRDSVHEAFGAPYELPNRTAYNETCANIANAMWNWRMLGLTGEAKHADVMERVLYNSMLSAVGVGGTDFFYTNVLRRCGEDVPLLNNDSATRWVDTTPNSPLRCFCCPPSVARTIGSLHGWAYGLSDDAVWLHLYGSNVLKTELPDGSRLGLTQKTDYPWQGRVTITVDDAPGEPIALKLRIPGWAPSATIRVNGKPMDVPLTPGKYTALRRQWSQGDVVELELPMEVVLVEAHPLVEQCRNHVAVMRGPVVYCLEAVDLPGGVKIDDVRLPRDSDWKVRHATDLLAGVTVLETSGLALPAVSDAGLYRGVPGEPAQDVRLRLIPYYAWCNRGRSEMAVWLPLAR